MKTKTLGHLENDQGNNCLNPVTLKVDYNGCC